MCEHEGSVLEDGVESENTRLFDYIWLLDADIFAHALDLSRIARRMARGARVSQPAVYVTTGSRRSDHPMLSVQNASQPCVARAVPIVEVMTPMFTKAAWDQFAHASSSSSRTLSCLRLGARLYLAPSTT